MSSVVLEFIGPYARLVMFATFTFMGTMASFVLSEVFNEKFYTEAGLFPIKTGQFEYVHVANIVKNLVQIFACILCATKVLQVPHETYVKPKTFADKYIWSTHEAVFLVIASGVNSNALAERFFTNDFFIAVSNDSGGNGIAFLSNEGVHDALRFGMIYSRLAFLTLGTAMFCFNLLFSKNKYFEQPPRDPMEITSIVVNVGMFVTHLVYGAIHFTELWPDSLIPLVKNIDTHEIIRERHLEFVSENLSEIALALFGIALSLYSCTPEDTRNSLAVTTVFNTVFLGFYGSFYAITTAFSTSYVKNEANTSWVSLAVFILAIAVTFTTDAIAYRQTVKKTVSDKFVLFYNALGANYTIVSFLWKLSIAGGLAALFMALFSTQAQWFTFSVSAGDIPKEVAHLTADAIHGIESLGHKGFTVVKHLDPCSWTTHDGPSGATNEHVEYTYEGTPYSKRPFTRRSAFSIKDADIQSADCSCKNGAKHCSCDYVNGIKSKITDKRVEQKNFAKNNLQSKLDAYNGDFKQWTEDSDYLDSLKQCHQTECDIVLGIAIASEAAIFAGDMFSFLPFVGEAVDTAAWFAQMGNRVGHNIVMYAIRAAKMVQGLSKRIVQMEPLVELLASLAGESFDKKYQMSLDLLVIYVPLFVTGATCFLIGFWRRENVHKVFQTYGVVLTFYIPLLLLNLTMVGLMFLFPYVIEDACKIIPGILMTVKPTEHVGFSLLRNAYIVSTISTFMLLVSALLDDAYFLRKKAGVLRKALRSVVTKVENSAAGPSAAPPRKWQVDMGWLQAFFISIAVPVLFVLSYHYNWSFVDMRYGPSGPLLKLTNSFHAHTNLVQDLQSHQQYRSENGLCGLIGKAVESAIKLVVKELDVLVDEVFQNTTAFVDSVIHFSGIISTFENAGKKAFNVLDGTWTLVEKAVTLIIPLSCSLLMLVMAIILPQIKHGRDEVEAIAKQAIAVGIYYNIAMLVMMQQLFATISNLDLFVFYFEMKSGPLVMVGFIATGLIATSLFSLFVNKIYKAET